MAPAGSKMRGRRNPQVIGMDEASVDRRIFRGRAMPRALEQRETSCSQSSTAIGAIGVALVEIHTSRVKPTSSLIATNAAPSTHKRRIMLVNWPVNWEAATASITVDGSF